MPFAIPFAIQAAGAKALFKVVGIVRGLNPPPPSAPGSVCGMDVRAEARALHLTLRIGDGARIETDVGAVVSHKGNREGTVVI